MTEQECDHDDFVTRPLPGGLTRFICLDCGEESDVPQRDVTLTTAR